MVRGGWRHTEEAKKRMSEMRTGQKRTEESRRKISISAIGRKYDQSFKDKARARQLGISPSDATRKKLSEANKGRKLSEQHIAKLKLAINDRMKKNLPVVVARVKAAHELFIAGQSKISAIRSLNLSSATYYKYVKMLSLEGKQ
jgi:hypothetical protein